MKRKRTFSLVPLPYPLLHDQGGDATSCHPGRKYPASTLDLAANLIMRTEVTLNPWRTTQWPEIRVQHQWLASTSPRLKTASAGEVRGSEAARTFVAGGAGQHDNARKTVGKRDVCVWWWSTSGCVGPLEVVSVARHANDDNFKPPSRCMPARAWSVRSPRLFWDSRRF